MKENISHDELSAHVDGEATDAEAVRRALQRDEDAARTHMAYARISAHLQSLPELAPVRSGFAYSVIAAIEADSKRRQPWWLQFGAPLAAAASLVLIAALSYRSYEVPSQPTLNVAAVEPADDANIAIATSEPSQRTPRAASGRSDAVTMQDMMLSVASADWFSVLPEEGHVWTQERDLPAELSGLDADDDIAATFLELLSKYAEEGEAL